MATNRKRKAKPILFNSPELHAEMLRKAYKDQPRWFDSVSYKQREDFALKYATKTWDVSPNGNPTSIVISYPRPDGTVRIYDLDSGEKYWVKLSKFTNAKVSGRANERMFDYSGVVMDDYRCESEDMTMNIDWESLEEWDKNEAKGKRYTGQRDWRGPIMKPEVRKLISIPKSVKINRD